MTFYNISSSLGNNSFQITDLSNSNSVYLVVVPDGNYTQENLINTLNTKLNSFTSNNLKIDLSGNNSRLYSNVTGTGSGNTISIDFTVNDQGIPDKYNFRYKLGWLLGFRNPYYTIIGKNGLVHTYSEQFIDLTNPRYLYLALEEFNKGNQKSFVSPIASSFINKNIIARISLDRATHAYGTVLPVNKLNGLLISDNRSYTGKIDLLKLNIKLLSENGNIISLNGYDFSFCLEVEHE